MAKKSKSQVDEVIDRIRQVVGDSTCDEKELYDALVSESDGWRMRLEELEADEEDEN